MQFGLDAVMEVICAFSDLSVGLDEVSSRRNSWRLLGGRVKRRGRDMVAILITLIIFTIVLVVLACKVLFVGPSLFYWGRGRIRRNYAVLEGQVTRLGIAIVRSTGYYSRFPSFQAFFGGGTQTSHI